MPMTNSSGGGSAWPDLIVWHSNPLVLIAVVGLVVALLGTGRSLTSRQRWALGVGFTSLAVLFASDIQARSMTSYRCHMIEHIVIVTVIAPIFASAVRRPLSKSAAAIGFLALTIVVPLYHVTGLGGLVMSHGYGHVLELATFLAIGIWFWTPVYGSDQLMSPLTRMSYVALAVPIIAITGLVLWSTTASYLSNVNMNMPGIDLHDIHQGGDVMMLFGTTLMLVHVFILGVNASWRSLQRQVPLGDRYVRVP